MSLDIFTYVGWEAICHYNTSHTFDKTIRKGFASPWPRIHTDFYMDYMKYNISLLKIFLRKKDKDCHQGLYQTVTTVLIEIN